MTPAQPVLCANPDHSRAVPAVARLTFPDGQFKPTTGCAGCRDWTIREAMNEARPILVEPIAEAYGKCPRCHAVVLLRVDGTLRAHLWHGLGTCEGRGQKPAPVRPIKGGAS